MTDYEKLHNDALEIGKKLIETNPELQDWVESKFPELRKNEDEKIRKGLIKLITYQHSSFFPIADGLTKKQILYWLEKQSEQKPITTPQWMIDFLDEYRRQIGKVLDYDETKEVDGKILAILTWLKGNPNIEQKSNEWSEEDEAMHTRCIGILGKCKSGIPVTKVDEELNWLKSFKLQLRQKWSEEDELMLKKVISSIKISRSSCEEDDDIKDMFDKELDWLESLNSTSHWKPTDEQMEFLSYAMERNDYTGSVLNSLYNDLKKL